MLKKVTYILLFVPSLIFAQYPFQDSNLSTEDRVEDLIGRLSTDEKIDQLMNDAPAIERLGIPKYNWWNESLHGVARAGYATVFPQSISIAASWNRDLVYDVATAISDEARAKYHEYQRRDQHDIYQGLTMWSPNINIFRDPRWGRGHETYGEDPFLTGQLGMNYVKGLQGDNDKYFKVVATAKHYAVHSGPEVSRHVFDANPSQRDLWETYLPAFRTLVKEGNVQSVMTAYNRIWGEPASSNTYLFKVLRDYWGFDGYVVSDCGAINDIWEDHKASKNATTASALALEKGTDLNCGDTYKALKQAVKEEEISEEKIDIALRRLFTARFKLGMFDNNTEVPYAQIPYAQVNNSTHQALARKAARESVVLLKNENQILPISKDINRVAVIGPNADNVQSLWGNYNGTPKNAVTILQGIKNKLSPEVEILYEEGTPIASEIPSMSTIPSIYFENSEGKQGLDAFYYDNKDWEGEALFSRIDDNIDFIWDINPPDPRLALQNYSVKWEGFIKVPDSGTYYFSDWGKPYLDFKIGDTIGGGKHKHHPSLNPKEIKLQAGKKYPITVRYSNLYGNAEASMKWSRPNSSSKANAIKIAEQSDIVVLALGLNERLEGEEMSVEVEGFSRGDRTSLDLPKNQVDLMKAIVATGKPVVLVLINGSALSINYAKENIGGILTAGYPGEQGGNAVADVLFGDYNPAGRLPVTYYKSTDQLPDFEDYDMEGRTYRYFEDEPLYNFGHGLSYTRFKYSDLKITNIDIQKELTFSVKVTNTGDYNGDEVLQLYFKDEKASTPRPIVQLAAFKRIHLKKGESKEVNLSVNPRQLAMINANDELVIEPGWFSIYVGGKLPEIGKNLDEFLKDRFRIKGKEVNFDY
ncbi:beta-glucosidase [Zunongwangia mangrovi]|uniref:Beta-glucosidase n=1 Tax=Zunongwangia mangrovi TaxID=1334022 RepID=A0A1I1LIM0_9FLAO|nr:glycoside hydrolase family 3 C-terminal domain-containing protein [Zunongwangia mangrovi]SFC72815.1 beta-glucosidase [Zunongwangia mangrovi]